MSDTEQMFAPKARQWQQLLERARSAWECDAFDEANDAFGELRRISEPWLLAIVRRKLPAAQADIFAEEFVAEAHLELWEMIEAAKPVLNVKPLLGTIVRRRIIDAFRRRAGVTVDPIDDTLQDDGALDDIDAIDTFDANRRITNTILDALPADERHVLSMRYLDRLSVMETAARLGLTEDQVKKRCQKALQLARHIAVERGLYDDMA